MVALLLEGDLAPILLFMTAYMVVGWVHMQMILSPRQAVALHPYSVAVVAVVLVLMVALARQHK